MRFEIPFRSGDEYDYMTRFRRWISVRAGQRKRVKRLYRRRCRVVAKQGLRNELQK